MCQSANRPILYFLLGCNYSLNSNTQGQTAVVSSKWKKIYILFLFTYRNNHPGRSSVFVAALQLLRHTVMAFIALQLIKTIPCIMSRTWFQSGGGGQKHPPHESHEKPLTQTETRRFVFSDTEEILIGVFGLSDLSALTLTLGFEQAR